MAWETIHLKTLTLNLGGIGLIVQSKLNLTRNVWKTDGKHGLVFAVDPRTVAEVAGLIFLDHLRDAAVRQDVARVDQPVQHFSCLLDLKKTYFNDVTIVKLIWL